MSRNGLSSRSMGFQPVVIVGAARTPVGVKCGTLSRFCAEDLAVAAAQEAMGRAEVRPERVDAVIGANVYQFTAPGVQDIYFPRNVGLRSGLDPAVPALMVQRICGSGIQTLINAYQQIALPDAVDSSQVVLCVAAETMSRCPRILRSPRRSGAEFWEFMDDGAWASSPCGSTGARQRGGGDRTRPGRPCSVEDTILASLNHDLAQTAMMRTADEYGAQTGVTRRECDEFAVLSQERAREAWRQSHVNGGDALRGMFIFDATTSGGQRTRLARDECTRETSLDALSRLPGLTPHGLVSPGNASEIADGAGAVVLASRQRAEELGLPHRWEIAGYGVAGVEPRIMGRGPVPAIQQALARAGIEQKDVMLWEVNEAFAAQYLGVEKELGLDREIVNVNGGAIAVGHPLAATGVRLIVDLVYEMERRNVKYGCASACIGGGQGVAMIVRRV